jgi:hypothetical protein
MIGKLRTRVLPKLMAEKWTDRNMLRFAPAPRPSADYISANHISVIHFSVVGICGRVGTDCKSRRIGHNDGL